MKRLRLIGRSGPARPPSPGAPGELHYHKTQYTYAGGETIDTPGEYSESKQAGVGLACFSFESDVVAILIAANEPFTVFAPNCDAFLNRPLIGVITKIHAPAWHPGEAVAAELLLHRGLPQDHAPHANLPMGRQVLAGRFRERLLLVDHAPGEGIPELRAYLEEDVPTISLEEAKRRQRLGLHDWETLPAGA